MVVAYFTKKNFVRYTNENDESSQDSD